MTVPRHEFTRRSERIDELVSRIENCGDPAMRSMAKELLQCVLELHAAALEQMLDAVAELPEGDAALRAISQNDLTASVLSLHGLHPVPLEARVQAAVEHVRPYLKSHGGNAEVTSIENGIVHVRLQGAWDAIPAVSENWKQAVETAIHDAAPEIAAVIPEAAPSSPRSPLVVIGSAH